MSLRWLSCYNGHGEYCKTEASPIDCGGSYEVSEGKQGKNTVYFCPTNHLAHIRYVPSEVIGIGKDLDDAMEIAEKHYEVIKAARSV